MPGRGSSNTGCQYVGIAVASALLFAMASIPPAVQPVVPSRPRAGATYDGALLAALRDGQPVRREQLHRLDAAEDAGLVLCEIATLPHGVEAETSCGGG